MLSFEKTVIVYNKDVPESYRVAQKAAHFFHAVTVTPDSQTKKITIAEQYVDSCVVTSLDNVPSNLRNGGLIILKQ